MTVAPLVASDGADDRAVGMRTGELFATHARMVFAVCRSILRDPSEAEDATQAAFLSAHEALASGSVIRDPGAWLATIARNECRARLRDRSTEPLELYAEVLAHAVTTDDAAERRATAARLRSEIAALPDRQREAVVLRDLYGLSYGEVGVALGVSRPSVEALLFRARRTLRVRLRPIGGTAIVAPVAVREALAQAVPWFAQAQAVTISAAAGAGAVGQLAGPVAAKLAVGVVAFGVTGHAVVERVVREPSPISRASMQVEPIRLPRSAGPPGVRATPLPAAPAGVVSTLPAPAPAVAPQSTGETAAVSPGSARRAADGPASPLRASVIPVTRPTTSRRADEAPTRTQATNLRTPEANPTRTGEPDRASPVPRLDAPMRELPSDPPTRIDDPATTTVAVEETGATVRDDPESPTPTR